MAMRIIQIHYTSDLSITLIPYFLYYENDLLVLKLFWFHITSQKKKIKKNKKEKQKRKKETKKKRRIFLFVWFVDLRPSQ